jgi:adenosine deaminase/aminodeoxyfutalosine deaminase
MGLQAIMSAMGPVAELHLHLEGSVEVETFLELDPALTREEIARATAYIDFEGFIQSYIWVNKKLQSPGHYALAARRLFERLAAEGVVYAEVTISAGVILWKQQDFLPIYEAVQREACLSKIRVRWILDATRQFGVHAAKPVFDLAAELVNQGVVAIGLGGFEGGGPARWYADLFKEARDRGLRLVCHAGETTDAGSVWEALEIGAERIGHGIRAIDDPLLVAHLKEKNIPLEICITSNVRTGAVGSMKDHPVRRLYDAGVPIILNTDDPALFGCTLTSEYEVARREFGFTEEEIEGLVRNSFSFAFDGGR